MSARRLLILIPALLSLLLLLTPAASAEPGTFTDTVGTSHEAAVGELVGLDIVRGCDEDRFCSSADLTRGQTATILVKALDLESVDGERFSDSAASVHGTAIETLADAGLISGCEDGRFCPSQAVTRGQLATMVFRAFDVPEGDADVTYFDDSDGVHGRAVAALAGSGITSGCTLTSFCSSSSVQRAHAAVFVARALDLVDRTELRPYDERRQEQDEIDEEKARKAEEAAAAEQAPADEAVDVALDQLGKPYQWGGNGPNSFDCSGLTRYAWAAAGVDLPRTSSAQYSATTRISRSELRPGDLVFYHSPISHVAMYIGDGKVVEAPNSGNNVRIREDGLTRNGVVGYGRP